MSSSRVRIPHPHVRLEPEVLGGSPFVEGSRVPVRRLWAWHQGGLTVDTLLKRYPQLGPARVLDALAFAYDNQELIEEDLERERELMAQAAEKTPTPPAAVVSPTVLREAGHRQGPPGGQQAGRRR
jgi:uncharacterized protein (DUF433 family)